MTYLFLTKELSNQTIWSALHLISHMEEIVNENNSNNSNSNKKEKKKRDNRPFIIPLH